MAPLTYLLEASVHELQFAFVEFGQFNQIVQRLWLEADRLRVELIELAVCSFSFPFPLLAMDND